MFYWLVAVSLKVASAASVGLLLFYIYMRYRHTYWQRRGVTTAPGDHWFFGHFKEAVMLRKSPGLIVTDLYQMSDEKDEVLGVYFFHKPFLMVRSPRLAKHVLIKDFTVFPNHNFCAKSVTDKVTSLNLFNIVYPDWKYLRTKLTPVFTSGKVKKLFPLMVESAECLKEHLASQFATGPKTKTLLPVDLSTRYTTDVISSLAFGLKTNSFTDPPPEFYVMGGIAVKADFARTMRFFFMFFFPDIAQYLGGQMLGPATPYFRKVFWNSMNTREASGAKRGDLIDSLLELKNEEQDTPFQFDEDALLAQSAIFFLAGRETSIANATFTLYLLAKHPEIQEKTREEIRHHLDKYGMTYEGVLGMKYLFQVMSEAMRIYPAAAILDRCPIVDYKIPGTDIVIEKGTPAYVSVQGFHLDEKYHPNPNIFDPERFSDERKGEIETCTYLPFGEGPRTCIGMRVGSLQTAVSLITVLKDYEVSVYSEHQTIVCPRNVFVVPPHDFKLNFTKLSKPE